MHVDVDELVDFLIKHKITFEQYMFLILRHRLDMKNLEKYIKKVKGFARADLRDLIDRGFMDDLNSPGQEQCSAYFCMPKFTHEMWIEHSDAGEELWNTYPSFFCLTGGVRVAARSCDKELLEKTYGKRIKNNLKKHKEVIELLNRAKEMNDITMGIEKFVASEHWTVLKEKYNNTESRERYGEQEITSI